MLNKLYLLPNYIIMEISVYIGSLLGPVMVFIGIGLMLNPEIYKRMIKNYSSESLALFAFAVGGAILGLLMVYSHNLWSANWYVVITVLSWLILIKSALLLMLPKLFESLTKNINFTKSMIRLSGIIYLLVGLFITYSSMM